MKIATWNLERPKTNSARIRKIEEVLKALEADILILTETINQDDLQWGDIWLKRNENFCPTCKAFTLAFDVTGCFD